MGTTNLLTQVQNSAAHGTAGYFLKFILVGVNALDRAFLFYLTLVVFFYVNGSEVIDFSSFILTLER